MSEQQHKYYISKIYMSSPKICIGKREIV